MINDLIQLIDYLRGSFLSFLLFCIVPPILGGSVAIALKGLSGLIHIEISNGEKKTHCNEEVNKK